MARDTLSGILNRQAQLRRQSQTAAHTASTNELLIEQLKVLRYIADTLNRIENRQIAALQQANGQPRRPG